MAILKKNLGKLKIGIRKLGIRIINSISDLDLIYYFRSDEGVNARGAAQFTSANGESLYCASNASLQLGTGAEMWLAAWVYLTSKGATKRIAAKYEGQREYLLQYDDGADRYRVTTSSNGAAGTNITTNADTFGSPPLNTWTFCLFWYDNSVQRQYVRINALAPDNTSRPNGIYNYTAPFAIGGTSIGTVGWDGRIDQVAYGKNPPGGVSGVINTIGDVLYNGGSGITYNSISGNATSWGLVSFWDMSEPTGVRHDSHNTNHLTDGNTVTYANGIVEEDIENLDPVFDWSDQYSNVFSQQTVSQRPSYRLTYIDFDGTDDFMSGINPIASNSNFSHFMKLNSDSNASASNERVIYCEEDATSTVQYRLAINENGNIVAKFKPSGGVLGLITGSVLSTSTDYVIATVRNGTDFSLYVDGLLNKTTTVDGGINFNGASMRVGTYRNSTNSQYFDGKIYNNLSCSNTLSSGEVLAIGSLL